MFVWGIELSGLLYMTPMVLEPKMFHSNSLVFYMTGGNYTAPHCIAEDQPTLARITHLTLPIKDVRMSGTLLQLTRYYSIKVTNFTILMYVTFVKGCIILSE